MREYVNYELLVLLPLLIYLHVILSHIKNMYFFHLVSFCLLHYIKENATKKGGRL